MGKAKENGATTTNGSNGVHKEQSSKVSYNGGADKIDDDIDNEVVFEFGGSLGVLALMILFPLLMLYFTTCLTFNKGAMITSFTYEEFSRYVQAAAPTPYAFKLYCGFCFVQLFFSSVMPGLIVYGEPVPSEGNKKLPYLVSE